MPSPSELTALAIVVVSVSACALAAGADLQVAWVSAAAVGTLVVLNVRSVPRRVLIMSLSMTGGALILLPLSPAPFERIAVGLKIGGVFVSLIASVSLLVAAARRSVRVQRIAGALFDDRLPAPNLTVTFLSHLFPAFLNIGGSALLCEMAASRSRAGEGSGVERGLFAAIHRGFPAASCWSPIFGNLALLLLLYPNLEWPDVAPYGFATGVLCSLMSLAIGPRIARHGQGASGGGGGALKELLAAVASMVPLMLVFLFTSLSLHRLLGVPVAVIIAGQAPLFALLWNVASMETLKSAWRGLIGDAGRSLPRLAPEAIFFAAGGCMMSLLTAAIPEAALQAIAASLQGQASLTIALILGLSVGMALVGVHPVLTTLLLAASIPPEQLGLSPLVHFLAVLLGWAVAFSASPYTILCFVISRTVQRSPFELAYRWNGLFSISTLVVGGGLLWILDRFMSAG